MGKYDNIKMIVVGGTDVKRVMYQNEQIWPSSYYATLTVNWTFGGNYSIGAIPAAGGYAAASNWTIHIFRASDNQEVASYSVNPTITIGDTTNFAYSNNVWSANDRARNGLNSSSGTTVPQSAPARSCSLTATASYTYQGISVSASYGTVMTQNANNAVAGTGVYENLRISLNKYNTSASPAPAYATSGSSTGARITAVADYNTPYRFVDGTTGAQGLAYTYKQPDAVKTNSFNLSCDWCTFSSKSSTGAYVNVNSRGEDYDVNGRNTAIRATLGSQPSFYGEVTIYQAKNDRTAEYSYIDFSLWTSPSSLTSVASSFSVFGTLGYKYRYHYDSGSYSDWSSRNTTTVTPTITGVTPTPTGYSGNSVSVPANTGSSPRIYDVTANYTDPNGGNWNGYQVEIEQGYIAYIYENPTVTVGYDNIGPASHTEYPTVTVRQRVFQGSTLVATLSGSLYNGATTGTASGDGMSAQFSVSYSGSARSGTGASFNSTNGGVTTASRGTTTGSDREVAYNIYATVTMDNGKSGSNSEAVTATQMANSKGNYIEPVNTSIVINSLSTTNITSTCLDYDVTATVKATWTDGGYKYSSYYDGDTDNGYEGLEQHTNVTVTGSSTIPVTMRVNGSSDFSNSQNKFTVNNKYNTNQAIHSVVAIFGNGLMQSDAKTVKQKADAKSAEQYKDYAVSVSVGAGISAAGGSCTITATGTRTKYKTWTDGTPVDVTELSPYVPDSLVLENNPGNSIFWKSSDSTSSTNGTRTATLYHRDMKNNVTTDTVNVKGTASTANDTEQVSVVNILTDATVTGDWGTQYNYSHDYGIKSFQILNYTSASNDAPFNGAVADYAVIARHYSTPYHDRSVYKKYSSWTAAKNDDDHREFYTTESEACGADTEVTGDAVTMYTGAVWLTINTTAKTITFDSRSSGNSQRSTSVSATNANGGESASITVYQGPYASISRTPARIIFDIAGEMKQISITWLNTEWSIDYEKATSDAPDLYFSIDHGGSVPGSGTTTVNVTAQPKSGSALTNGTITISPSSSGLGDLTIQVSQ